MNYAKIYQMSVVDGVGCRVSLFVSGCDIHCDGCFNSKLWNYDYGNPFTGIEMNEIIEACKKPYMSGLSILGGEPLSTQNQPEILKIVEKFKKECPDKNIWMFTGYVWDKDLIPGGKKYVEGITDKILDFVDVLVDGPFIKELKDLSLKFRGSKNQRLLTKEERQR